MLRLVPGIAPLVIAMEFADCEGTLGPDVCRKLRAGYEAPAGAAAAGMSDSHPHLLDRFPAAFRTAAGTGGAVEFH